MFDFMSFSIARKRKQETNQTETNECRRFKNAVITVPNVRLKMPFTNTNDCGRLILTRGTPH